MVADCLSRPLEPDPPPAPVIALLPLAGLDFALVAAAQADCPDIKKLLTDQKFVFLRCPVAGSSLLCEVSTGVLCPVLPLLFRRQAFDLLHCLSHPRVRASRRMVTIRFLWPAMNSDVAVWARSCLDCQRTKEVRHVKPLVHVIPVPLSGSATSTSTLWDPYILQWLHTPLHHH